MILVSAIALMLLKGKRLSSLARAGIWVTSIVCLMILVFVAWISLCFDSFGPE